MLLFQVVWEFLKQNMDWVGDALDLPPILPPYSEAATKVPPHNIVLTPKPRIYNPLFHYNKIFYTTWHQVCYLIA